MSEGDRAAVVVFSYSTTSTIARLSLIGAGDSMPSTACCVVSTAVTAAPTMRAQIGDLTMGAPTGDLTMGTPIWDRTTALSTGLRRAAGRPSIGRGLASWAAVTAATRTARTTTTAQPVQSATRAAGRSRRA